MSHHLVVIVADTAFSEVLIAEKSVDRKRYGQNYRTESAGSGPPPLSRLDKSLSDRIKVRVLLFLFR